MCHLQLRTLLFVAWVVGYIAFLLCMRRMWTGKYVRSPLARSMLTNMVSDMEEAGLETQEVCASYRNGNDDFALQYVPCKSLS